MSIRPIPISRGNGPDVQFRQGRTAILRSILQSSTRSICLIATIAAFDQSPDRGRRLARDMRVRWALEEVGPAYHIRLPSFKAMKEPAHPALHPFCHIPTLGREPPGTRCPATASEIDIPTTCSRHLSRPRFRTVHSLFRAYAIQNNPMHRDRGADSAALSLSGAPP